MSEKIIIINGKANGKKDGLYFVEKSQEEFDNFFDDAYFVNFDEIKKFIQENEGKKSTSWSKYETR